MADNNPMAQFEIKKALDLSFAGFDLSVTNSAIVMIISTVAVIWFMWPRKYGSKNHVPSNFQVAQEVIFSMVSSSCSPQSHREE